MTRTGLAVSVTVVALAFAAPQAGHAQPQISGSPIEEIAREDPEAQMLLEADELVYDYDKRIVSARGNVQIYYRGYTVEADSVDYNQATQRVFARGNVKVIEPNGHEVFADTVELTDDFREGFVRELTVVTPERARFASTSAERLEDNVTIFNRGVYTACEPCKEDPSRPLMWQIKAARIIHNQKEKVIYYEDASFELLGIPIAYVPYFSHPDPTVKRQSGFLPPDVFHSSELGAGLRVPYFFALAPNYDLTVAATGFTQQGVMGDFQWRHRLKRGSYSIEGAGINQLEPEEFPANSPSDRDFRGFVRARGLFNINEFWNWGFDGRLTTDRTFQRVYDFTSETEYRNQVFLTGQSASNWFDARVINYKSMRSTDEQIRPLDEDPFLPIIHPVVDYSYIFDQPVLGGRLSFDANVLSLTRDAAEFASNTVGVNCPESLTDVAALTQAQRQRFLDQCDLVGVPGQYNRFVSQLSWDAMFTDSLGQIFKPFASLRGDAYAVDVEDPYLTATGTPLVGDYLPLGDDTIVRGMPTIGLEYRWPFLISTNTGYQIIEPIAQIIARPDEKHAADIPNEDAQSLVFDDTILFDHDKFSGYDRVEGGTRANVGVRYKAQFNNGVGVSAVFGQSYQLAGTNAFPLGTGLETDTSDYVAGAYVTPIPNVELSSHLRFDESDFEVMRHDLQARGRSGPLTTSVTYSDITADPLAGFILDRQEVQGAASLKLNRNWRVFGSGRYELEGSANPDGSPAGGQWISHSFGVGYADECIALAVAYERTFVRDGDIEPDERITFRFNLRTVVEGETSTSIGGGSESL